MKYFFFFFTFSLLSGICAEKYLDDYLKTEKVFLLPELEITSPLFISYRFYNNNLYFVDNNKKITQKSIAFSLYKSTSDSKFQVLNLEYPNHNYSKNTHIYDLYLDKNNLYILVENYLLLFEREKLTYKYLKRYFIEENCTDIIGAKKGNVVLYSSPYLNNNAQNFFLVKNLKNEKDNIYQFSESGQEPLINVGDRKIKTYINDSTIIYASILEKKLTYESSSFQKVIELECDSWKKLDISSDKLTNDKTEKKSLMYFYEKLKKHSNVLNIFKLDSLLFVQYQNINGTNIAEKGYDVLEINEIDKNIEIKNLGLNYINGNDRMFSINDIEFNVIQNKDNYLSYIVEFPFKNQKKFKSKSEFQDKSYDEVLESGRQYSIIIKTLK